MNPEAWNREMASKFPSNKWSQNIKESFIVCEESARNKTKSLELAWTNMGNISTAECNTGATNMLFCIAYTSVMVKLILTTFQILVDTTNICRNAPNPCGPSARSARKEKSF